MIYTGAVVAFAALPQTMNDLHTMKSPSAYCSEAFQQPRMPSPSVHPAIKIVNDIMRRTHVFQRIEPHLFPPAESSSLHVSFGGTPRDESPEQNKDSNKKLFSLATPLMSALAILAFVVLFHEMGHYWMAKSMGVPVDEFSLGWGPKIASLGVGDGDTFSWRALPLGGYVSINRASMAALPWFPQVQILSAGVFFNLLLAWIIYTAQIWKGDGLPVPVFGSGIVVGGLVETTTMTDHRTRDNKRVASSIRPPAKGLLQPGDIIHAVNGKTVLAQPTASEMEVNRAIDKLLAEIQATPDGQSVIFTVVDPNAFGQWRVKNVEIQPRRMVSSSDDPEEDTDTTNKPSIGVYLLPNFVGMDLLKTNNPLEAATLGASQVALLSKETAMGIGTFAKDHLSGKGKTSNYQVKGPVGVLKHAKEIVQTRDWNTILNYAAAASINLGIFNFVPIPPSDGFQILLTTIHHALLLQQQH